MDVLNLNGYVFFEISDPVALREKLLKLGEDTGVMGSVLLAEEGINLSVSGLEAQVRSFVESLHQVLRIPPIDYKESWSAKTPFKRFWVKVKPEIVTMGRPGLPLERQAPYIRPAELRAWFQDGRDFVLLDSRKEFEYEMGHFKGAKSLGSNYFRDFPERLKSNNEIDRNKPVVTYCTGGIRCEKAAPLLLEMGFKEVYQLEGGILRYFEECGGEYFEGDCFVFDHRAAVNTELETVNALACRTCGKSFERAFGEEADCGLRMQCPECLKLEMRA